MHTLNNRSNTIYLKYKNTAFMHKLTFFYLQNRSLGKTLNYSSSYYILFFVIITIVHRNVIS